MLLRDLGRAVPAEDIAIFLLDPTAPLPSGGAWLVSLPKPKKFRLSRPEACA